MHIRYVFVLPFVVLITACGQVPTDPESFQDPIPETPLFMLPPLFRGAGVQEVVADNLARVPAGQFYPDFVRAQRFEYDKGLVSGHMIDYGSSVEVMLRHHAVFGQESPVRVDNDVPLLRRFNARLSIAQDGRPTLYLIAGQYVLHVTVAPDPANREIAKFLALLFAEEVILSNTEKLRPPPYFVHLALATPPVPQWGAVVPSGEDLVVLVVLDYTLLDADEGLVTLELTRDMPFFQQTKVVPVTRGMGTVTFVDTLHASPDIPDGGTDVTATFVLTPPYIDEHILGSAAAEYGVDIGGGRFSHTAQYQVHYRLTK